MNREDQTNRFDKIIKENLKESVNVLIKKVLGIDGKTIKSLVTKFQITDEREADFIFQIETTEGKSFILHVEFQTSNDKKMIYRMLRYYTYIRQNYDLPVRQCVFYIGHSKLRMEKELDQDSIKFVYELIDMRTVSWKAFIESENPEDIIMAVLCHPKNTNKKWMIREILNKLKGRVREETLFSKYIRQLEVLSQLRDLQKIVMDEENKMAITYDLNKDIRYQQGLERGEERGEVIGKILSWQDFKKTYSYKREELLSKSLEDLLSIFGQIQEEKQ